MTPADFRNWRLRLGLTQEELAVRLGRCRSGISKIEQGKFGDIDAVMVLAMRALEAGLDGEAPAPKARPGHVMVEVPIEAMIELTRATRMYEDSTRSAAAGEGDPQP